MPDAPPPEVPPPDAPAAAVPDPAVPARAPAELAVRVPPPSDSAVPVPAPSDPAVQASAPIDPAVHAVLSRYWGYERLRPLQAEAIAAGRAGRDSLVVLPTGGGKSLCYQIPAVLAERTDVVVSPLISLMKDQVDALQTCGYPAAALHSGQTPDERREVERKLLAGRLRLLFVAPERLQGSYLTGLLSRVGVRAFAIDEAHCISHWGHDFRPEYRQLAQMRERFPDASLHAYTATATQRVRADIAGQLGLRDPLVLVGCFDRPNLVYRIVPKQQVTDQTLRVLKRHARQAAIVYCLSRADTEEMAGFLSGAGLRAACYHAGLDKEERHRTQDAFANEQLDVVVATVAFGMGIDRSDVRCVVHAAMPKSIEHYQQETGRAGRDGLEAECVLFYSYADMARWERLIERSVANSGAPPEVAEAGRQLLGHMQRLCSGYACRHRALSEYFGQEYPRAECGACDVCLGEVEGLTDATVTAQKILSCVARVQESFGVGHVVDVLRGANTARVRERGHDRLSTFGLLRGMEGSSLQDLIYQLLDQGVLTRTTDEYPVLKLNAASWEVMRGQRAVKLREAATVVRTAAVETDAWAGVDQGLFEHLRGVRKELAATAGIPPFMVFHDATLRALARLRPTTAEGLALVGGLGKRKVARFAPSLLAAIRDFCREHGVGTDVHETGGVADSDQRRARGPRGGGQRRTAARSGRRGRDEWDMGEPV